MLCGGCGEVDPPNQFDKEGEIAHAIAGEMPDYCGPIDPVKTMCGRLAGEEVASFDPAAWSCVSCNQSAALRGSTTIRVWTAKGRYIHRVRIARQALDGTAGE